MKEIFNQYMREYREEVYGVLIENLDFFIKNSKYKNEAQVRNTIINELELPAGDRFIYEYASNPLVVLSVAVNMKYQYELHEESSSKVIALVQSRINQTTSPILRIRKIAPYRNVCGVNFQGKNSLYSFANGVPYLVTRNSRRSINEIETTELLMGNISREEVKTIAALELIMTQGFSNMPVDNTFCDIPEYLFHDSNKFNNETVYRAAALLHIFSLIRFSSSRFSIENKKYSFRSFGIDLNKTRSFYRNFRLNDTLLLRCASLLIKSSSLERSPGEIHMEDACANLFFGLEGCLRLLNRRFFKNENFNFKNTIQMIQQTFDYAPGYKWMLEDVYNKRVNIVHPESKYNDNWFPVLYVDDYRENLEMASDFIYFYVTGDFLKIE